MTKFFSIILFFTVTVLMTVSFAQSNQPVVSKTGTVTPHQVDNTQALLYDQTASGNTNGYASQDFETAYDVYDCQAADDFTATGPWNVTQVVVSGQYSTGGPADGFNVYFYQDNGGMPGTQVYSAASQPYTYDGVSVFTINLSSAASLNPGNYWVSVQCRMDFGTGGQWYWNQVDGAYGSVAQWQNPGGGFGTTCSSWGNIQTCVAAAGTDQYFALYGDITPVELTSFTASAKDGNVVLNWATATETNNNGFQVERKSASGQFENVAFIQGYGTTTQPHQYSFIDKNVANGNYTYRLKQIDLDGTYKYSQNVEVSVKTPDVFSLKQNYPNPFNPTTKIDFTLASDSKVTLKIFNLLGQEVSELLNSNLSEGFHSVNFNATNMTSGVYFYKLSAQGINGKNFTSIKKMILTK